MSAPMKILPRLPVVVILGATGCGKSKLAIELARKFNGEIISADSMQVYKGLDIITNKVTAEEQAQCRHHMISYVDPLTTKYTVTEFRNKALAIIDKLIADEKLPVIVGGTNYYIESVLWNFLVDKKNGEDTDGGDDGSEEERICNTENANSSTYDDLDNVTLHKKLMEIDIETAQRLHPNDRRKVLRALEIYEHHDRPMSEILSEQRIRAEDKSGPLRYESPCIFWIQCEQKVLDGRLDDRVDEMIEKGLLNELTEFHHKYNRDRLQHNQDADYETGIFQSIGFKEFHPYLMLDDQGRQTYDGQQLLEDGIERLKLVTRRYSKKQQRWIKNRFLKRPGPGVPSVYGLDSTDPVNWTERVNTPACNVLQAILNGDVPAISPLSCDEDRDEPDYNICTVCEGRVFVTKYQWQAHMKSRRHRHMVGRYHRSTSESSQGESPSEIEDKT
ncbi:tRNA dimethylallyltransferase-like [Tubulanus polymorphus]|uniref:tRNA dimethylallyltransferase-like n=1 Tax=Tubulanus polymorphus TaxID=672921 RepID=UPI003DA34552